MSLAWVRGVPDEQHQVLVERQAEATPRLVSGDHAEQLQIETRRDDVRPHGAGEVVLHVLRDDDGRVGPAGDNAARQLEHPAGQRDPVPTHNALHIVTPERHHQRQELRQRQQPAHAELGVHQIVGVLRHAAARAHPGPQVVPRVLGPLEVEHVHLHARRL